MTEWREVKLEDIVNIKYGKNQKKVLSNNGSYPIYGTGGLIGYATHFLYDKPSVLIGRKGTIGKVKYIDIPFWTVDTLFYTEINENKSVPKFLFYYLSQIDLNNYNEGTTIPSLRTETLNRLKILLPPLDIQKKIAGVLGALDDKIELNNKINQNLEAQAQALFKSWFIDFEPFGGKMPNDWKIGKLSDIAEYSNDTISTEFTSFENYISTENMLPNRGGISRASSLPTGNTVKSYRTTDVLISNIRPYFKKIWFALFSGGCSNDILVFRSKKDSPAFVFNVLNQDDFFEYVMSGANGSKMPRGDKKHIMQYKVIIPSAKTIKEFENIAITFLEKFSNNNQENVRLAELRDTLLPKLMSGEINVDNVEMD